ncbi:uncharacterized protein BJ171DRAFT_522593 [Polychytrium aggregatum]|uniref:uncharacterized protein n=1 Tax=Polychytrium aggregatum TaxID=110093 RepID=UPI0022FE663C|nr:uncharacterized protein BJ171DRAFT_522593 [Polychytrium aggregatum]KAI9197100.1 hypothetical protein BJ171DRAFT_522593 [Polychytrium aggregatum]
MVGWMHYLGRGTVRDQQKGVKIIRVNQSNGLIFGENECLASIWNYFGSDSPTSRKFYELCRLGSERDWLCKHLMAICLINGFGTPTNQTKAADIFEQLANDGHSDSQLWIGMCFYREWGVSEDHRKAFEWFTKSANQDNPYGQWWVGVCYLNGYGVTKDHAKAAKWSRISAEQGNRYGQDYLGNCYEFGLGVPEDIDTAVFWYRKSADQGHRDAIDRLEYLGERP